ncbi:SDR family NAD(P)-dependent oxidoreductase [Propionivibrio limicola]|uniref:SDR family NAD(P)-dependent oxidoreductase n=1 Tax=Propionivibrio limicola TaxID=167645 RepID=UPI001292573C|nr:SDR family NAD(P)-dependent oxidoreductase [Propionivibrio limicola]
MFDDLKNKRVLITGATQGIGLAAALAFARQGAHVGITSRTESPDIAPILRQMQELGGEGAHFAGDLSSTAECRTLIERFVERFGGIDVLINNVGGLVGRRQLPEIDDDFFDQVIDLNARSAHMTTRFAIPHLKAAAQQSGTTSSVILVGSFAAYMGGGPGASLYAASKAWLHTIQKNWVTAHTKDGIRFNVVSPGTIDTAFHADKGDAVRAQINTSIPMGRFGRPEEIAPSFLFLASHACSGYITGQVLNVNGGQYMP